MSKVSTSVGASQLDTLGVAANPSTRENQTNGSQTTKLVDNTNVRINTELNAKGLPILETHNESIHFKRWNHNFIREAGATTTLSVAASKGDTAITVVSSTGFAVGELLELHAGATHVHEFYVITAIVSNVITLDRPISRSHAIGSNVDETATNMAVSGTLASPVVFEMVPQAGENVVITRFIITLEDNIAMDDSKFGGLSALTNGVYIRVTRNAGAGDDEMVTIWKSNGDIAEDMFNLEYVPKTGGGVYGLRARWTLTASDSAIKINGDNNDKIELLVQDNLTGLINFRIKAQGYFC